MQEAIPINMVHTVKSLKSSESSLIKEKSTLARNDLGQSFGTKKRKKTIKDLEMNQIRVENMQDVTGKIKQVIGETASSIPLKEELDLQVMADRPIPKCNVDVCFPVFVTCATNLLPFLFTKTCIGRRSKSSL